MLRFRGDISRTMRECLANLRCWLSVSACQLLCSSQLSLRRRRNFRDGKPLAASRMPKRSFRCFCWESRKWVLELDHFEHGTNAALFADPFAAGASSISFGQLYFECLAQRLPFPGELAILRQSQLYEHAADVLRQ